LSASAQDLLIRAGVDIDIAEHVLSDADEQWLLFTTNQDILPADRNEASDIYRLDLFTESLTLLSRTPQGTAGNGPSRYPAADATGELVVFQSDADDLVEGDTNGVTDIFLHDVPVAETIRVTAAAAEASEHPALDAAGEDLLYDQRNADGQRQVLIDGLWDDTVAESVSLVEDGAGISLDNHHPAISADGRYVAYLEALADGDAPTCAVHVYDRDTALYQRTTCPDALAADPETARPYFSSDGSELIWYLSGAQLPVVVPNALLEGQGAPLP
jgi:Tol biopolymer transport system component